MQIDTKLYLTTDQLIEKYPFLTKNRVKNLLFANRAGFRTKVTRKLGRLLLFDENALLQFIDASCAKGGANES